MRRVVFANLIPQVLCETRWLQDGTPQAACPRFVARKQLEALEKLGFKLQSTYELEFFLLELEVVEPAFRKPGYLRNWQRIFATLNRCVAEAGNNIRLESSRTKFARAQMEVTIR